MTQTLTFKIDRVGTLQLTRKQGTRGSAAQMSGSCSSSSRAVPVNVCR